MLTFEQIKAMEAAIGQEAAKPFIEAFQTADARVMTSLLAEVATKTDIAKLEGTMRSEFAKLEGMMKSEIARVEGVGRTDAAALKADMAKLEGALKADMEKVRVEISDVRGDVKRLDLQIKLLIGLAILAIAMFSPNLAALLKLAK